MRNLQRRSTRRVEGCSWGNGKSLIYVDQVSVEKSQEMTIKTPKRRPDDFMASIPGCRRLPITAHNCIIRRESASSGMITSDHPVRIYDQRQGNGMARIHSTFCRCMSTALYNQGVEYAEFCADRGYRDFKLDLDSLPDHKTIAAEALCQLCYGAKGSMNHAVIEAVFTFLEEVSHCRGRQEDCIAGLLRLPSFSERGCREWVNQWFD